MKSAVNTLTAIALIAVLLLMTISCHNADTTKKGDDANDADATYVYYSGSRINCKTGNVTYLYVDPLCDHQTAECPFYGFYNGTPFYVYDKKMIYTRRVENFKKNHPHQNFKLLYMIFQHNTRR